MADANTEETQNTEQATVTTDDKGGNQSVNIENIPKEVYDAIYSKAFQSDRFNELTKKAKQADSLLKDKAEAEAKALEANGEWQKIAEAARSEAETFKNATITSEIKAYAAKLGAVDLEDVAKLVNREGVKLEDGVVTGAEDVVKALAEAKPHLFNKSKPSVGSPTNPGDAENSGIPKFRLSDMRDPKYFAEHKTEILKAISNGTAIDDRA